MKRSFARIADVGVLGLLVGGVQAGTWNAMLVVGGPHPSHTSSRAFTDPSPTVVLALYSLLAAVTAAGIYGSLRWARIRTSGAWTVAISAAEFAVVLILDNWFTFHDGTSLLLAPILAGLLIGVCFLSDRDIYPNPFTSDP